MTDINTELEAIAAEVFVDDALEEDKHRARTDCRRGIYG